MKSYQGHRSWNAWNVCLWIFNEYGIYCFAVDCVKEAKGNLDKATTKFMRCYGGERTPDGGRYTRLAVRLALEGVGDGQDFSE